MSENTALWDKLGKTDPAHTKGFTRGGGFKGTAIKPMWSYRRMTEEFGPVGQGWGINAPSFEVVPGTDGETLVFCTVSIWYEKREQTSWGVGGDKVIAKFSSGMKSDDEAFKKAFTDAITNALKMIGVGADVHMGMFDDSKYVNTMQKEFAEEKQESQQPKQETKSPPKADARPVYSALEKSMRQNRTSSDLASWWKDADCKAERAKLPDDWHKNLHDGFVEYGFELKARETKLAAEMNDSLPDSVTDREAAQHPLNA